MQNQFSSDSSAGLMNELSTKEVEIRIEGNGNEEDGRDRGNTKSSNSTANYASSFGGVTSQESSAVSPSRQISVGKNYPLKDFSKEEVELINIEIGNIRKSLSVKGYAHLNVDGLADDGTEVDESAKESISEFNEIEVTPWSKKDEKLWHVLGDVIIGILAYICLMFLFGFDLALPDGPLWALIFLWFCSFTAGNLGEQFGIPSLLSQLIIGLVLRNLPGNEVFLNLPVSWSNQIKAFGLCTIFLRSGLELDLPAIIKQGLVAARLTCLPGIVEAFVVGGVANAVFDMPMSLSISLGFILAAVSPAVVVTGMFDLQKKGLGIDKGIPSLVVAAASFDDVVALTGFSVAIGTAIPAGHNPILSYLHAPIEVFGALILGVMFGHLIGCTIMWNKHWKRTLILFISGLAVMYFAVHFHYNSMGALGSLIIGLVSSKCWKEGRCGSLSLPPNEHWVHEVEFEVAKVWRYLAQPLLFSVIGASIAFDEMSPSTIPNAVIVIACGVVVRCITASSVTFGAGLTVKERIFIGMSWIPKATVQAALGSIPLTLIEESMEGEKDYDEYKKWGEEILVTAVFAILITAPIGVICIDYFGPRWLHKTEIGGEEKGDHDNSTWILREARRRVKEEDVQITSAIKAAAFFEQFRQEMEAASVLANEGRLTESRESILKCKEAGKAMEDVVNKMGSDFPISDLFDLTPKFMAPNLNVDRDTGLIVRQDEEIEKEEVRFKDVISVMRRASGSSLGYIMNARRESGAGLNPTRRKSSESPNVRKSLQGTKVDEESKGRSMPVRKSLTEKMAGIF